MPKPRAEALPSFAKNTDPAAGAIAVASDLSDYALDVLDPQCLHVFELGCAVEFGLCPRPSAFLCAKGRHRSLAAAAVYATGRRLGAGMDGLVWEVFVRTYSELVTEFDEHPMKFAHNHLSQGFTPFEMNEPHDCWPPFTSPSIGSSHVAVFEDDQWTPSPIFAPGLDPQAEGGTCRVARTDEEKLPQFFEPGAGLNSHLFQTHALIIANRLSLDVGSSVAHLVQEGDIRAVQMPSRMANAEYERRAMKIAQVLAVIVPPKNRRYDD